MESNNGYDLLWRILKLTVPGFDPTFPVKIPTWSNDGIFDFAHVFQLYYRLLSKKGDFHDDKTCSTTFLQAISYYAFADLITTLLTCINFSVDDDGYLPGSLCIMGLAHQLNKAAKLHAKSVFPRANRLGGETRGPFNIPIQGSLHVFRMDAGGRDRPPPRVSVLPYKLLPKLMIIELMHFCIMWMNSFSVKLGISEKWSPREIVSRHKLDAKMHCKVPFEAYCEIHVYPYITNMMEPRTKWGICLGPTGNMQGSYKFLSLSTGKKVTRRKFTEMPMTDSVIKMIDSLGKKKRCKNGLSFKNRKGEEYTYLTTRTNMR